MADYPWFKFYAQEYLADGRVTSWSLDECGAFIRLLCHCWTDGSIPNDMGSMAKLLHVDGGAMRGIWSAIGDRFIPHPDFPGRLTSPRIEKQREEAEATTAKRADAGKKGANSRWDKEKAKHSKRMRLPSAGHEVAMPVACDGHTDPETDPEPKPETESPRSIVSRLPAPRRAGAIRLGPLTAELVAEVERGLGKGLLPLTSQAKADQLEAVIDERGVAGCYDFVAATCRSRDTDPQSVGWLLAVLKPSSDAGGVQ